MSVIAVGSFSWSYGSMNRIREIRERAGLNQSELARRVGTSPQQIGRLEDGDRRLTTEWLQKIAAALDVTPQDLLAVAVVAGMVDDVKPIDTGGHASIQAALARRKIQPYEVTGNAVEGLGIKTGSVITCDESVTDETALKMGDIVLAEIASEGKSAKVLRLYAGHQLLVTNRRGANTAIRIDDASISVRVIGVILP